MVDVRPDELAYAAGYFDGEGSISILAVTKYESERVYHRLQISVASTDEEPLRWLHARFGGWVGKAITPRGGQRPAQRWTATDRVAENFLRQIRPWLIIKAERADLGLAFRVLSHERGYNRLPEGVAEGREEFRQQMLRLNRRGIEQEG